MMKNIKKVLCCLILLITMFATCNKVFAFQVGDKYHKNHSTTVGTYNNVVSKVNGNKFDSGTGITLYRHTGYQVDNNQNKISGDYNFYCLDPTRQAYNVGDNNKANYTVKSVLNAKDRKDLAILYIATKEGYSYDTKSLAIRTLSPTTIYYEGPNRDSNLEFQKGFYNASIWWLQHEELQKIDDGKLLDRFFGLNGTFENCYKSGKKDDACIQRNVKDIKDLIQNSYLDGYSSYMLNDGSVSGAPNSDLVKNALKLYVEAVKYADGYINSTSKQRNVVLSDITGKNPKITVGCETNDMNWVTAVKEFDVQAINFNSTKIPYDVKECENDPSKCYDALTIKVNVTGKKNLTVNSTKVEYTTDNGKTWKVANKNGDTKFIDLITSDNQKIRFRVTVDARTASSGEASFDVGATVYYKKYYTNNTLSGAQLVATDPGHTYQRFIIATGKPNEIGDHEVKNIAPVNVTLTTQCKKECKKDHENKTRWTNEIELAYNKCQKNNNCSELVKLLNLVSVEEAKKVQPSADKSVIVCEAPVTCKDKVGRANGFITYTTNKNASALSQCLTEKGKLLDSDSASCFQNSAKDKAKLTCSLNVCTEGKAVADYKESSASLKKAIKNKDYVEIDYLLLLNPGSNHAQAKKVGTKEGRNGDLITCKKEDKKQYCYDVVGKANSYKQYNSVSECANVYGGLLDKEDENVVCLVDTLNHLDTTPARLYCSLKTCDQIEKQGVKYSKIEKYVKEKNYTQIKYELGLTSDEEAEKMIKGSNGSIVCKKPQPQTCEQKYGNKGIIFTSINAGEKLSAEQVCNQAKNRISDPQNATCLLNSTGEYAKLVCKLKTCTELETAKVDYVKPSPLSKNIFQDLSFEYGLKIDNNYAEAKAIIPKNNKVTCHYALYRCEDIEDRPTKYTNETKEAVVACKQNISQTQKLICDAYLKKYSITDKSEVAKMWNNNGYVACGTNTCTTLENRPTKFTTEIKNAVDACTKIYKKTTKNREKDNLTCNNFMVKYNIGKIEEVVKIENNNGNVKCDINNTKTYCTDHTTETYTNEIDQLVQAKNWKELVSKLNLINTDEAKKIRKGSDNLIVCTACSEVEGEYNSKEACEKVKASLPVNIPDGPAVCSGSTLYCYQPTVCEDHIGEPFTTELSKLVQLQTTEGWSGITKLLNLKIDNNLAEAKKVNESPNRTIICEKPVCSTRLRQIKENGTYKEYATEAGIVKFNSEITINEQNPAAKLIDGEITCEPLTCDSRLAQIKANNKWNTREYMGTIGKAKFESEITDPNRVVLLEDEHLACGNVCTPETMPDKNDTNAYRQWMSECCYPTERHFNVYDQCSVQQECMAKATTDAAKQACLKDGKDWCSIYSNSCVCGAKSDIGNSCLEALATDKEVELSKEVKEGTVTESDNINLCIVGNRAYELKKHDAQNVNDKYVPYNFEQNTGNPYCKVYCKEDYSFNIPRARYTINGQYFTLGMRVESTKSCYTDNIDYNKFNTDYDAAYKTATELYNAGLTSTPAFKTAVKDLNTIINNINACGGDWYSDYNADPEISFTYDEEEYIKALPGNKLKLVPAEDPTNPEKDTRELTTTTSRCSGNVDDNYNCSTGWKEVTLEDEQSQKKNLDKMMASYKLGDNGTYVPTSVPVPNEVNYSKKVINKKLDLVPESVFYTEYSTGVVKVGSDGLTDKYTVLQSKLFNDLRNKYGEEKVPYATAVPVELKTGMGIYNYTFNFDALGENLTTGEAGRIITKDGKTLIDGLKSDFQGNYMCKYVVNCPNCRVKCVEDPSRGIFCEFEDYKCDGDNCPLVCSDYGCAYDAVHGLLFTVRNFDNTDVNPDGVTPGVNLDPSVSQKAEAFIEEVEGLGDEITKEPEYSFEFTPSVISTIRSKGGQFSDNSGMKCENYSKKIEELAKKYPDRYTKEDIENAKKYDYQVCESELINELAKDGKVHTSLDGRDKVMSFFESDYCKNGEHTCVIVGALPKEGVTKSAPQGPAYK